MQTNSVIVTELVISHFTFQYNGTSQDQYSCKNKTCCDNFTCTWKKFLTSATISSTVRSSTFRCSCGSSTIFWSFFSRFRCRRLFCRNSCSRSSRCSSYFCLRLFCRNSCSRSFRCSSYCSFRLLCRNSCSRSLRCSSYCSLRLL